MSVYNKSGSELSAIYDLLGNPLATAYGKTGIVVFSSWDEEISVEKLRDSSSSTSYYKVIIPQTRINGDKQFPFVYAPNGTGVRTLSTLEMNEQCGFYAAINGGIFNTQSELGPLDVPLGILIQNGVVLQSGPSGTYTERRVLTIDSTGVLACVANDANTSTLIANGVVSAVCGFGSIIENFVDADTSYMPNVSDEAQRQIIGQFENGDYCILTCEGRGYDNSDGWTIPEAQTICKNIGLKFAYNLDGGGSTETVIGNEQINTIYEGTYGRKVPTYIVFNGADEFFVPES